MSILRHGCGPRTTERLGLAFSVFFFEKVRTGRATRCPNQQVKAIRAVARLFVFVVSPWRALPGSFCSRFAFLTAVLPVSPRCGVFITAASYERRPVWNSRSTHRRSGL